MENAMATHSSVLAWRIPGMTEPDGLPSMGSHRVGHDWSNLAAAAARTKWFCHVVVCNWRHKGSVKLPSRVRLFAILWTVAYQTAPYMKFSRQEYWSGLQFSSPMHEGEKWKWSRSVLSDSEQPHGLQPTRLLHPWDFPSKSTGVGCHRLLIHIIKLCKTKHTKKWVLIKFVRS